MGAASARALSDESHRIREASNASWICSTCAGSDGPSTAAMNILVFYPRFSGRTSVNSRNADCYGNQH
jgi:hypothetical protein